MAGYSGQEIALDVDTPSQLEQAAAQADLTQTQSQLARATAPADAAIKNSQAQMLDIAGQNAQIDLSDKLAWTKARESALAKLKAASAAANAPPSSLLAQASPAPAGNAGAQSPLSDPSINAAPATQTTSLAQTNGSLANGEGLFSPGVTDIIRDAEPNDPNAAKNWDAAMKAAAEDGDPTAAQFVGKYTAENLRNWQSAMGAHGVVTQLAQTPKPMAAPVPGQSQLSPQPPVVPPAAQPPAQLAVNPETGTIDSDMLDMAFHNPEGAAKIQSMLGMMQYQKTGDPNILRRYAPDLFNKYVEADKTMSDTAKQNFALSQSAMGSVANGLIARAKDLQAAGKDPNADPELQASYRAAVTQFAQRGWLTPQVAAKELANPNIDLPQLEQFSVQALTSAEWFDASGQKAAAEAKAKAQYPGLEFKEVRNLDGTTGIWQVGGGQAPKLVAQGAGIGGSGAGTDQQYTGGWTPRARNGGDNSDAAVDNKIAAAAKLLGVDPHDDISHVSPALIAQAMTANEGGAGTLAARNNNPTNMRNPDGTYKTFPTPQAGLAAAASLVQRKLANGQTTVQSLIEGLPVPSAGGATNSPVEAQAQAIANGMQAPLTGRAATSGIGAAIMGRVYAINPQFDARGYTPQVAALKSFTSGADSKTVQALSNAGQHLVQLNGLVDALNNGDVQTFNRIGNAFSAEFGGTAPTNFAAVRQMVGGEIAKVIAGGVSGEGDRQTAAKWLSDANSPSQLKDAIIKVEGLLGSQANTLRNKYQVGTGRNDFDNLLVPEVRNIWGKSAAASSGAGTPAAQSGPPRLATRDQVAALPAGTQFLWTDGKVHTRK